MRRTVIVLCLLFLFLAGPGICGLFENTKILKALQDNSLRVGMTKQELISVIGYPPEGRPKQDNLFYRFVQTKVTAGGKEESWTYQIGASADGVRSVTFKIVNDKLQEWNEWLDTVK